MNVIYIFEVVTKFEDASKRFLKFEVVTKYLEAGLAYLWVNLKINFSDLLNLEIKFI